MPRLIKLGSEGPAESASRIASDEIDVLVDLKGYTDRTRSEIMALRPAHIQVSFLGYVGSQGGDWIDYILADKHVLPFTEQQYWTEHIVHLPNCYYPNDRSRPMPGRPSGAGRALHGLEDIFVFACFNSPYKITASVFNLWMDILKRKPDSALWLYEGNEYVAASLRREAKWAGIDQSRLIFGRPMDLGSHIDRHAYVDLFLDTFPYGAHTTGADALWAGVPMVSICGRCFASRVGKSLLYAVGLEELVCSTPEQYVALAVALANDPARLSELRQRLETARVTSSLFDAALFTRGLESAYLKMTVRRDIGESPTNMEV